MEGVEVRFALKADIPKARRLMAEVISSLRVYNQEARNALLAELGSDRIDEALARHRQCMIVALKDGRIIGAATIFPDSIDGTLLWLDWVIVQAGYRRRGVAKSMIGYAMSCCKSDGARKIWADSRASNKSAIMMFKSAGFRQIGRVDKHWFGQDYYLWEKPI